MAGLGLPQTGGDGANRTPIIKYDARAGRIFRVDRSNESGSWETEQVEITNGFQAIMDLENIETGWLSFPAGGAPDIKTVKIGTPMPERPSDKHKSGFRILMKLGKSSGGDVREMAANAQVSIKGMDALYRANCRSWCWKRRPASPRAAKTRQASRSPARTISPSGRSPSGLTGRLSWSAANRQMNRRPSRSPRPRRRHRPSLSRRPTKKSSDLQQ
jgi:hypothetical protein